MKQAARFANRHQIIAIFCVLTVLVGLSWIASGVSSQSAVAVEPEISVQITEAAVQGTDSLKRFGALKVSSDAQSKAAGSPRVAVAADFDSDGVNDLLVAHNDRLVFHRGNINAFAPQTEEAWEAIRDGRFVSPFERKTRSTSVPAAADFIFSGDFNRDTHLDVAFAARGDNFLYVLEGDGAGNFSNPRRIETAGAITALASGDVNCADGLTDLIVGTRGTDGFGLQVFSGLGDIFAAGSLVYNLPSQAEAIAVGQLNENEFNDIAVGTDNEVIILSGIDSTQTDNEQIPEMRHLPQPGGVKSIVTGDLMPDRDNRTELGVLSADGTLRILARGSLDTRPIGVNEHLAEQVREYQAKGYPIPQRILAKLTKKDLREPLKRLQSDATNWVEAETVTTAAPNSQLSAQSVLTTGRMSGGAADDLIVLDQSAGKVLVMPFQMDYSKIDQQSTYRSFKGKRATQDFDADGSPVAALALKLNYDNEVDLLVLKEGNNEPEALVSAAGAIFTVTTAVDDIDNNLGNGICGGPSGCTLRAAIMEANRLAGDDTIMINAGINPVISRGQPDNDGAVSFNDQSTGDLDITCAIANPGSDGCAPLAASSNNLTIIGAAGGNTVSAGTFTAFPVNGGGSINTDRVFDVGQDGIFGGGFGGSTGLNVTFTNLTIQNGNVREALNTAQGAGNYAFGGGIRYDGFRTGGTHGTLTLTNSTINNNQSDNAGGGVYQVYGTFSAGSAGAVTFSNNITKAGEGGGLFFGAGTSNSNVNITNSTFSTNEARKGTVFGTPTANADGGGLRINADPNTVAITNTNFTNNIAQQDGGAIKTLGGAVTVTGGTMTGNTARRHGGVAFGDQDTAGTGRTFTFSGSTMRNNTANSDNATAADDFGQAGDGGAIFRDRGVLNITNCTIGGTALGEPNTATNGGGVAHFFTVDSAAGNTSNQTTININGGSINGNVANTDGGGVYFNAALFDVTASILNIGQTTATALDSNKAKNNGGGINTSNAATANLKNMTLRSNQANSDNSGGGDGGALYQDTAASTTTFTGTLTIGGSGTANSAVNGGGIRNNAGTVTIPTSASITFNTATGTGGGISNAGTLGALATPTITNNTAVGNGGGIFNTGTLGAITNPQLNLNSAATGGGIFSSNGALSITGGSVSANTATTGKGGGIEHSGTSTSTVTSVTILNNTKSGILITGTGSLDAVSNTITGNGGDGIGMTGTGVGSHFNSNVISGNVELGIDLLDNGVTLNDAGDADTGPNNLQNFPVLNYVRRGDGIANVTLNSTPGKYRVQYYKNAVCDASGFGEGEALITSEVVTVPAGGTLTYNSGALAFDSGTREQITATATSDPNANNNFDDDGSTSEFSACRKVNTLPTISAQAGVTRQQGSLVSNSQVATVADPDQPLNTLVVTVNGGASATVAGVTVSNIQVSAAGVVTADIAASCGATVGDRNFTLRVTDNATEFNEATLTVTVTANTPPTLGTYPNTTVNAGSGTTVTPTAAPTDNGTVATLTAAAPGFTGTFSGNTTTGVITVSNAGPAGTYTVTVTATDNCGATTTGTFTLTVNAIPTITGATISRQQGSPLSNSQIATVNDTDQAENTLVVTVNGGASATVNGVTVSNIIVDASGNVTADVAASCAAANATFTLTVTDSNGASSNATLTVNVTPNTPPTVGTYPNTNVTPGSGTTVTPTAAPADNGSIASATATASAGFTGGLSVNSTTGVVTVSNANPVGAYTVTVTLTDNCGATTMPTFTLTVTSPPTITATTGVIRSQGNLAASSNSQIATVNDADQTENTLVVTVNGGATATVNGVTVSNIAVDAAGNVTASIVASATATTANFTLRVTDAQGAFTETTLTVTVGVGGFEADVAPRPNGDGNGRVNGGDVTQVQRFAVGLDRPFQSNEFQRADSAPRADTANDADTDPDLGNGSINGGDVTQAQRYAVNLDGGTTPAGGPTGPAPPPVMNASEQISGAQTENGITAPEADMYTVTAVSQSRTATTITIAIQLNSDAGSMGAASVSGTLRFETAKIGTPTNIRLGSGAPVNTSFFVNDTDTANGRLGFTINTPVNQTFAIGQQQLLLIDFTIVGSGSTVLSFDDSQAETFVGDISGNEFTTATFPPTTVSLSPTAATVSIGGRVLTPLGRGISGVRLTLTDANGRSRTVTSTGFGYYRFEDVEVGATYILSASGKNMTFSQPVQVLNVNDANDRIDFIAEVRKRERVRNF